MKAQQKTEIILIDTDTLDSDNTYYLYEIITNHSHYYYCTSDEELSGQDQDKHDYSTERELIERSDMTDKEFAIAKTLFHFLWNSNNGTNTCMDYEQLEEEHISRQEVEEFVDKFQLNDALELYEEDGVEIYWQFLCSFDLMTCDFFA